MVREKLWWIWVLEFSSHSSKYVSINRPKLYTIILILLILYWYIFSLSGLSHHSLPFFTNHWSLPSFWLFHFPASASHHYHVVPFLPINIPDHPFFLPLCHHHHLLHRPSLYPSSFSVSSPVELLISQTLCWVHDDLDQVDFSSYLLKVCGREEVLQKWVHLHNRKVHG